LKKVIVIGGSPMIGKTTISTMLGARLLYPCISSDDVGEILQTVVDINPMKGTFYLDYYANSTKEQLIKDLVVYHQHLETAIYRLIEIHSSSWKNPLIIEGYALYPDMMNKIKNDNIFSIWLIAENDLLKSRMMKKSSFYQEANNPDRIIENYLYRSEWQNRTILEQCRATNQKYMMINEHTKPDEIVSSIYDMITTA